MRASKTKISSVLNHPQRSLWRNIAGAIVLLTICLTLLGNDKHALAEEDPAESGEVAILGFDSYETDPGTWELSGQVDNHDGENTVVDFGGYLAGESTPTGANGFFIYYCYASGGETVTAVASCVNGTSDEESTTLN